jgi:alpha-L-fucosidase 2
MKFKIVTIVCLLIQLKSFSQSPLTLWYDKPAKDWNEALPIGNGSLGAMIFGAAKEDLIQLNEQTLWTCKGGYFKR